VVFGVNVHQARYRLGQAVARECPVDADIIVPVPDSGHSAALGYARESGIPQDRGIVRNHYVGRTFIQPGQRQRELAVSLKHNVVRPVVAGQRLILVEDSLVRGTTMRGLSHALRAAGAREVHLRLSCPPNLHPCFYGVGFPTRAELIAANLTVPQIRAQIGLDSVGYCSLEGAKAALAGAGGPWCDACFTGRYPVAAPED
jgi:amidophosphoribosyltransferase